MLQIILLSIGMFALGLDAYVMSGLLPALERSLAITSSQAGQTVTVFTLCYALSAPIFSTFINKVSINRILQIALFVFAMANIASALSTNFTWLLVSRCLAGVCAGIYAPMAAALSVKLVPSHLRGRALAFIIGGMSTGVVVGVPIGLMIANSISWQATLIFVASLGLLAMMGIALFMSDIESTTNIPTFLQRINILSDSNVAQIIGITFLTSVASLGLYTYLAVVLNAITVAGKISPFLWVWGIGGLIGSFSIGKLIDYTGRPAFIMTCILATLTLALVSLSYLSNDYYLAFIPMLIWGATGWSSQAPQQHVLISLKPEQAAQVVALNSSANYLGSSVGTGLLGLLIWSGFSALLLPLAAGAISLLALILHMNLHLKNKQMKLFCFKHK